MFDMRLDQALKHAFSAVRIERNDDMEKLHGPGCRFSAIGPVPRQPTRASLAAMLVLTGVFLC
ncbi:hypothetical protein BTHE68_53530 [Burkholderia sp. THE68]|nr:hypothetical protein BTHE68_53530 [Burkholderia sp. THE68]BCQ29973.1 hypothetical protein NK8_81640 [Caballeronia sp. NK8]